MPLGQSLFERLRHGEPVDARTFEPDRNALADSVVAHLRKMLNVRHGEAAILPDYGLPDFNDLVARFPQAIAEVRKAIRDCIVTYEPRLSSIQVSHVPDTDDPLVLRFEVTARLRVGEEQLPVTYRTKLGAGGQVELSEG